MRFPRLRFTLPLIAVSLIALTGVTGGGIPQFLTLQQLRLTPINGTQALVLRNSAAAANGRDWMQGKAGGPLVYSMKACDDAGTVCGAYLTALRVAASSTIADLSFGNAIDNNTFTFNGTGNVSINNLTVNTSASGSGFSNFARLNAMPFFSATNNSNIGVDISNSNNGTAAVTHDNLQNDLANGLQNVLTSSTFSGAFLTSGPTGQMAATFTLGAIPYCIGSNSVARMCWDSSGTITFPTGTSLFNAANLTGSLADARLSANVVKYNDTGTNFTGGTPPTIGGQPICVANGTNCPAAGIGTAVTFYKSATTGRLSTTTLTADPTLTTTALTAGKAYSIRVFVSWNQGGATTNGLQADITTNGASAQLQGLTCSSTTNTTAANAALSANQSYQSIGGPFTLTIGSAGQTEQLICEGTADFTSCASGCGVNFRWAQAASVATNTNVLAGSYMTATRLN